MSQAVVTASSPPRRRNSASRVHKTLAGGDNPSDDLVSNANSRSVKRKDAIGLPSLYLVRRGHEGKYREPSDALATMKED